MIESPPAPVAVTAGRPTTSIFARRVNLTRELAITQFKLKYTGSVLGYVWSLLNPLMTFAIMYVVFTQLIKLSAPLWSLQLLVAIVLWTYFVESVSTAIGVIAGNGGLIKKASFPRPILVIASNATATMTFVINLTLILLVAAPRGGVDLGWRSFLAIPLLLELYAVILGLSLFLSALFVTYRDLGQIWAIGSQALFYGSAIVYPIAIAGHYEKWIALNPLAQIVEDIRHCLVTDSAPWTAQILGNWEIVIPMGLPFLMLAIGFFAFRRAAPRFAEFL